jgi:phytoene dehydrogenase-like protein
MPNDARPNDARPYDAIVIGGGHNGLIAAAYLARSGRRTVVIEARDSAGGCASTVDALDGARVNICSCDHRTFRTTPIIDELNLYQHGLQYLDVEPAQLNMADDGSSAWPLFHDLERTLDALRLLHPDEVDNYRRYAKAAMPVAALILKMANETPSARHVLPTLARSRAAGVTTLLKWSRMSVGDVLRSFFSTSAFLGPAVATGPAVWGLSPETPGTGLGAISYALGHVAKTGRPVGGSGNLPTAVLNAFKAAGGELRTNSRVTAVRCEGEHVRGVTLHDGTEIDAPVVIGAADPHTLFVEWLRNPPAAANATVERWRTTHHADGYESKIDAVIDTLPEYHQFPADVAAKLGFNPVSPTMYVSPSLPAMHQAWLDKAEGKVAARPIMFANMPSVLDPTMRLADGSHVFSLEVLYTPYALAGGWEDTNEPERWLENYARLVQPGWLSGVRRFRTMTPAIYESDFHMPRGHATAFAGGPVAALLGKTPELTRYHTPVKGLFVTGAAAFPGAGVWGAPGRNAARVVLAS